MRRSTLWETDWPSKDLQENSPSDAMTIVVKAMSNQGPMSGSRQQGGGTVILSTLNMIVRPERRSDLLETMRGMLEPARVERGCLSYRLYEDVENRNAFILVEAWKTQQDLENHIRTDNQRQLLELMDLLREQPELRINTVSSTVGMDLIRNVLKTDGPG